MSTVYRWGRTQNLGKWRLRFIESMFSPKNNLAEFAIEQSMRNPERSTDLLRDSHDMDSLGTV